MDEPTDDIAQSWTHATSDISARGLERDRTASPAERTRLATALEILAVDRLEVHYRITPRSGGRYRLTGTIRADVVQACVVTLDPVATTIEDRLDVEFRPPGEAEAETGPATADSEASILDAEEHETIEHNRIAAGRIVAETLAAALPSHPRAPDAVLEQHEAGPSAPGETNPFAALAGWKPKPE